jgi:Arc/MetJ-type ribon-helix-helix transcriptional regulator
MASTATTRRIAPVKPAAVKKPLKERILIEFPAAALRRADAAARAEGVSRSEFIRAAVEERLEALTMAEFERELEESYKANAEFNLQILKEFEHVDREAFYRDYRPEDRELV